MADFCIAFIAAGDPAYGRFQWRRPHRPGIRRESDNPVAVLLGRGDGRFLQAKRFELTDISLGVAVGKFNNDRHFDIAASDCTGRVALFAGNGDGTFRPGPAFMAASGSDEIVAADLDGDGCDELAIGSVREDEIEIWSRRGTGPRFTRRASIALPAPISLSAVDIDTDVRLDLNASDLLRRGFRPDLNTGSFTFSPGAHVSTPRDSFGRADADCNGDGKADAIALVWPFDFYGYFRFLLLQEQWICWLRQARRDRVPEQAGQLEAADMDADGNIDAVATSGDVFAIARRLGTGDSRLL